MKFYKNFTKFQKGFFIFFTVCSILVFLLPLFLPNGSFRAVFSIIGIIGLISTLSGILVSIYTAKAQIEGYVWWWINSITMAIICLEGALYGQFIQNLFISVPLEIYGFIAWKRNMKLNNSKKIAVRKFTSKEWIFTIIAVAVCWVLYSLFLYKLPALLKIILNINIPIDSQLFLDAFTSVLTIIPVYLTGKRFIEQWFFWLLYDAVAIIMFMIQVWNTGIGNPAMLVGNLSNLLSIIQYVVGVTYGYILWVKMYRNEK